MGFVSTIPLGDYRTAFVDAGDYQRVVDAGRWFHKTDHKGVSRAVRNYCTDNRGLFWGTQTMESFILRLGAPHGPVLFKDGNTLNCTRANMEAL